MWLDKGGIKKTTMEKESKKSAKQNITAPIRIGYSLSLSGILAPNGKTALLAHKLWEENINNKGGLLGRPVRLVCIDDQTNPNLVPGIYQKLLTEEKTDLIIGGYGDNSIKPAMSLVIEHKRFFVGLMGVAVNQEFNYENYFVMIPTGPNPGTALTEGFFSVAAKQDPKPETVAILSADAAFSKSPVQGAKENCSKNGMRVVFEETYPLSTNDFSPFIRKVQQSGADILFMCSYVSDSVGLIRAINKEGLQAKLIGGAMIGPQNGSVKLELGPLLNGLVNYEYWLPVEKLMYPGVKEMIEKYQARAQQEGTDPLGYYAAPMAYAQLQIVEQAVTATQSLNDNALAAYTRDAVFHTVVGDVKFGKGGGWTEPRVLTVQYQQLTDNTIAQFRDAKTQVVLMPETFSSGNLIYPYIKAKNSIK
jgi:branched-chain amino acid transport system substrate-binding protein